MDSYESIYRDQQEQEDKNSKINNRVVSTLITIIVFLLIICGSLFHVLYTAKAVNFSKVVSDLISLYVPAILGSLVALFFLYISILFFGKSVDSYFEVDKNNVDLKNKHLISIIKPLEKKVSQLDESFTKNLIIGETLSKNELYKKFSASVENAKSEILLTSFYDGNPELSDVSEQRHYFEIIDRVSKKSNITIKRTVSVPTKAKYDWVMDLVKRYQGVSDYNLRFINFNKLGVREMPPHLNIQIIDNTEVFIINPLEGFNSRDRNGKGLYFKNSKLIEDVFRKCYDKLWEECQKDGTLMTDGTINERNKATLIKIWSDK